MLKVAGKFVRHVVPGVVRPLHALWNQIVGFCFLAIAGILLPSAIRDIQQHANYARLALSAPFIVLLTAFGISSFLRARRISRT